MLKINLSIWLIIVNGACAFVTKRDGRPIGGAAVTTCAATSNSAITRLSHCLDCCSATLSCDQGAFQTSTNVCELGTTQVQITNNEPVYTTGQTGYQYFYVQASMTGTTECPTRGRLTICFDLRTKVWFFIFTQVRSQKSGHYLITKLHNNKMQIFLIISPPQNEHRLTVFHNWVCLKNVF